MISKVIEKLRDPEYRKAFVASQINIGIPFQIRGLLKSRGWKQDELVRRTGMLQPRISALLTPGKVRPNIETLRRIAGAFDCGLEVRFVPFSELVLHSERFNPETFDVASYPIEQEKGVYESLPAYDTPTNTWILAQSGTNEIVMPAVPARMSRISTIEAESDSQFIAIPAIRNDYFIGNQPIN